MTSCKNGNKANDVLRAEKTKDGNVNWELQVKQFKAAWKRKREEGQRLLIKREQGQRHADDSNTA